MLRAQQLLVQQHVDPVPVVARPVALAVRGEPGGEARRHVVDVDERPHGRAGGLRLELVEAKEVDEEGEVEEVFLKRAAMRKTKDDDGRR